MKFFKNGQWELKKASFFNDRKDMDKADECHSDDPKHEQKEQKAAAKIKESADKIIELHKEGEIGYASHGEVVHGKKPKLNVSKNGQWKLKE